MSRKKVINVGGGFEIHLEKEMVKYSYSGRVTFEIRAKAIHKRYPSEYIWERFTSIDKNTLFGGSWESRITKTEEKLIKEAKSSISSIPDFDVIFK